MRAWLSTFAVLILLVAFAPAEAAGYGEDPPTNAIQDWSTLHITLSRSMCFGACPSYKVDIAGDGTVTWTGERNVAVIGTRTATIPKEDVAALYEAFVKADFMTLKDSYRAPITDLPEYRVGIRFDGHEKTVLDYMGQGAGMPAAVSDLEKLIDKTAGTEKWIKAAEPPTPRPTGY